MWLWATTTHSPRWSWQAMAMCLCVCECRCARVKDGLACGIVDMTCVIAHARTVVCGPQELICL